MPTRADVADAIARLDRADLRAARWFGAKGRAIADVRLDEAFVLDPVAAMMILANSKRQVR